ncbi:alpha/beta hydrolase [Intrasporangium calvum]|uniref:Alpha/beta hydrolase n=1 Tax=Intrasporangium calvum TaxID=53358 RepID=A0ABT5GKH5_9MICO|nr:alpha/beta hydrolase [Intrasporangium calvum]MDC5698728.1 alpha/beta hydrolase [Intrasporangium calvum]
MASWQMRGVGFYLRLTRRRAFATESAGEAMLARPKTSSAPSARLRRRLAVTTTQVGGFDVHTVRPREAGPGAVTAPVVVYLHGGAYCNEIVSQHWSLIADIAEEVNCEVQVPIYGLAPCHTGLEALAFVTSVLEGLAAEGRPVHLVGDSAGGGLALLAAQAVAERPEITVLGVTAIAPWLDLTMSNPGIDAVEQVDPWLARPGLRPIARAWAGDCDLSDPRLSPIDGDLATLPPVDIWVGTRDITWPDCQLLRDRLPAASLAGYHEEADALHVTPLLPVPEGRVTRRAIIERLRQSVESTTAPSPSSD